MTDAWEADDAINHEIGMEIRALRDAANMSRPGLVEKLPYSLHVQTLLYYELGTRQIPLGKLEAIAQIFGTSAEALIGKAVRAAKSGQIRYIHVDVIALRESRGDDEVLAALRTWALNRPTAPNGTAHLPWTVVVEMAAVLGVSAKKLAERLREFQPTFGKIVPTTPSRTDDASGSGCSSPAGAT